MDEISCHDNLTNLTKGFEWFSERLPKSGKHFGQISLTVWPWNNTMAVVNDNSFADLTFDKFRGDGVSLISNNAFGITAETITDFYCWTCPIQTSPPKYHIWKAISHLTQLTTMTIGLNVTEIPADAFLPINGQSELQTLTIVDQSNGGLIVKSGAFQNMNNLRQIKFPIKVKAFEKGAFRLTTKSDVQLLIIF